MRPQRAAAVSRSRDRFLIVTSLVILGGLYRAIPISAQPATPSMLHPRLDVRRVASGLVTPTTLAFLGPADFLVLEKNTGRVIRVTNGAVQGAVLDLAVNAASERGLLGIALHPNFPANPGVYLFWSCRSAGTPADPFVPDEITCANPPSLGADSEDILAVPLLANRVDRFAWNGSSLTFDRNLIGLRAFQNDAAPTPPGQGDQEQIARANHDGGILRFGHDGKLYVLLGDVGRRGQMQNLPSGPTATGLGPVVQDDQFGGPAPDDEHLSGVILRLNDDGTTPSDNPFFAAGAALGGEVGANVQKIFAYGIRNSFGMAFDPFSGGLWLQENGEDAFDEINRVEAGVNSGWIQIAGPAERVAQFRQIETTSLHHDAFPNLQQFRWGPERIAQTPAEALSRLFALPGSRYHDPEFSWKYVLAPAGIGFASSRALGPQFEGNLFVGFSTTDTEGGPLFRFKLTGNRRKIAVEDPRLEDRVADNLAEHDMTESESLIIGRDFGIITDIATAPNGNLYVVSLDHGVVYEIFGRSQTGPGGVPAILSATGRAIAASRGGARVEFELAAPGAIDADVHDLQGRIVRRLARGREFAEGTNALDWNGRTDAGLFARTGVYFLRLSAGGEAIVTRVLWMP